MFRTLLALVVCCAVARVSSGQVADTTVRIHVPQAPSGATFTLVAAAHPAVSLTRVVTADDEATFRHVPVGQYRVVFQLPGVAAVSTDVFLVGGGTYEWLAEVTTPGGSDPGLTLRPIAPQAFGNPHTLNQAELSSFPADDTLWSVVETATASLIADRMSTGGLWAGEAALIGGTSSWRQTAITRGELDVTDPLRAGTAMFRANHAGASALVVATSMLPASTGGPGAVLTLIPPLPTSRWTGDLMVGVIPRALQSSSPNVFGVRPIAEFDGHHDGALELGGPLGGHAGIFLSARQSATDRVELREPAPLNTRVTSFSADMTMSTRDDRQLRLSGTYDRTDTPYVGRARLTDADPRQHNAFGSAHATWQGWTSGGSGWSASTGFVRGTFDPQLNSAAGSVAAVERLYSGPIPDLFELPGTSQRWSARLDVEPELAQFRGHLVRAGVSVARNTAVTTSVPIAAAAELVNGIPARLWEYRFVGADTRWRSTEFSGYVSDGISLGPRVRLDAGLRLELMRAGTASLSQISWVSPLPRVAVRWLVDSAGRFSVYGGFNRYADRLPLDYLAYGDDAGLSASVYRWNDADGDHAYTPAERAALVAAVGPCCAASGIGGIDPDLNRPVTRELTAGVDTRFGDWSLRLGILHRRTHDTVGVVNTGVGLDDYTVRLIPDLGERFLESEDDRLLTVYDRKPASFGNDRYLLTNPPDAGIDYEGFELTVDGRPHPRLRIRFDGGAYRGFAIGANRGYGALENDPGVLGEAFTQPNAATYGRGRPMFDRAYVMKWWAAYIAPKQFVWSAVARYQDGQPFARMVVVPDLNQGVEAIPAYWRGRSRFAFTLSVDTHVEKTFSIGRLQLAGIVEVFNLLNTNKEWDEDVLTTAAFRTTTALQPPRATRIGVRLAF